MIEAISPQTIEQALARIEAAGLREDAALLRHLLSARGIDNLIELVDKLRAALREDQERREAAGRERCQRARGMT